MVAHHGVQGRFALVVGGMGFEHEARLLGDEGRQFGGGIRIVMLDAALVEIDARLHHHGDDAAPGAMQLVVQEGAAVHVQRAARGLRAGDGASLRQRCFTAGYRHFRADHVDGRREAGGSRRRFGDEAQARRAGGHGFIVELQWIVGTAHAAIEVDFMETGRRIRGDQGLGVGHGGGRIEVLPGVRAKMVAAQHQAAGGETLFARQCQHGVAENCRRHARVAAELVDLVRGRFDQQHGVVLAGHAHGGAQHARVAAAHGVQSHAFAAAVRLDHLLDRGQGKGRVFHLLHHVDALVCCRIKRAAPRAPPASPKRGGKMGGTWTPGNRWRFTAAGSLSYRCGSLDRPPPSTMTCGS